MSLGCVGGKDISLYSNLLNKPKNSPCNLTELNSIKLQHDYITQLLSYSVIYGSYLAQ